MSFDIKLSLITRERFVAGGKLAYPPQAFNYRIFILCHIVSIILTNTEFNDQGVRLFDIGNTYMNLDTE